MSTIQTTLTGYLRYQGREGQLAFLLHRLTGLGTLLFLLVHILDTATVYFYPSLYEHAVAIYRSTPFMIGEILLVFSVIYHGVNGLRIAYFDLFKPAQWNIPTARKSVRQTLVIATLLWLPAAGAMLYSLILHNFVGA